MHYHSLIMQHFRSYANYSVELSEGVNIIVGPNGSGKTNLLEALYYLSVGSSFRTHDRNVLQHNQTWFRIEGLYGDIQRVATYQQRPDGTPEKQFLLDGVKKARLMHAQRVPVVLFEPDHLRLLKDSPSTRREYLDTLLIKLHPDYSWAKHQLERVLLQRNNILKRRLPLTAMADQLFVWDIKFAELSEQVVRRRQELLEAVNQRLSKMYSHIAHTPHTVAVSYEMEVPMADYNSSLLKQLHARAKQDSERGFTTVGPHRDDFTISINNVPASVSASRGEVRSLLLALKIIELQLLAEEHETTPLLLLDDVFSELDASRRKALADLAKTYQTLITTTDADAIIGHFLDGYNVIATDR